jgi:hypothetical protein
MPHLGKKTRRNILTGRRPSMKKKGGSKARGHGQAHAHAIVPTFLHMLNTVKLYHWKTTNFATHKATDGLYSSLNEKIDQFVEVLLGKKELGGRAKLLHVTQIKLGVYSNNDAFIKQIELYKTFLLDLTKVLDNLQHTDLLAIRDEILAEFNQFLYLLTLRG